MMFNLGSLSVIVPLIREICFVSNEHNENIASTLGSYIVNPLGGLMERIGI